MNPVSRVVVVNGFKVITEFRTSLSGTNDDGTIPLDSDAVTFPVGVRVIPKPGAGMFYLFECNYEANRYRALMSLWAPMKLLVVPCRAECVVRDNDGHLLAEAVMCLE